MTAIDALAVWAATGDVVLWGVIALHWWAED